MEETLFPREAPWALINGPRLPFLLASRITELSIRPPRPEQKLLMSPRPIASRSSLSAYIPLRQSPPFALTFFARLFQIQKWHSRPSAVAELFFGALLSPPPTSILPMFFFQLISPSTVVSGARLLPSTNPFTSDKPRYFPPNAWIDPVPTSTLLPPESLPAKGPFDPLPDK